MEPMSDVETEITYLSTENGGREGYVASGYRGQFHYGGQDWDAPQYFVNSERVEPGETVTARLRFLSPQAHIGRLEVGTVFLIREGHKTVGYGKVTKMLNLEAHAFEVSSKHDAA